MIGKGSELQLIILSCSLRYEVFAKATLDTNKGRRSEAGGMYFVSSLISHADYFCY